MKPKKVSLKRSMNMTDLWHSGKADKNKIDINY